VLAEGRQPLGERHWLDPVTGRGGPSAGLNRSPVAGRGAVRSRGAWRDPMERSPAETGDLNRSSAGGFSQRSRGGNL
jgi:hypothetical protein